MSQVTVINYVTILWGEDNSLRQEHVDCGLLLTELHLGWCYRCGRGIEAMVAWPEPSIFTQYPSRAWHQIGQTYRLKDFFNRFTNEGVPLRGQPNRICTGDILQCRSRVLCSCVMAYKKQSWSMLPVGPVLDIRRIVVLWRTRSGGDDQTSEKLIRLSSSQVMRDLATIMAGMDMKGQLWVWCLFVSSW